MVALICLLLLAMFAIVVTFLSKLSSMNSRLLQIEWEMKNIKTKISSLTIKSEQPQMKETLNDAKSSPTPVENLQQPLPAADSTEIEVPVVQQSSSSSVPPPSIQVPISRTKDEWEAFVGGKLLNRIGAIALVIGIGFFLKYAFENNWITETMRVVIGMISGIGVLYGGIHTNKKGYQIFAQGLFGAGIAILYTSCYASFNFYHLVPQAGAFGMMSVVTVVACIVAIHYDSLAISLLAWAGGFLTPFLLSTGHANEIGLFAYIALLEAGLIMVVFKKSSWFILEPLTLVATYLVFYAWYFDFYSGESMSTTIIFLIIFWGILFFADVVRTLKADLSQIGVRQFTSIANIVCYYWFMYDIVNPLHHDWMGFVTLLICIVYGLHCIIMARRYPTGTDLIGQTALTSIILLVLATAIQYSGFTTIIFWSVEGLAFVWLGVRKNLVYLFFAAVGLFAIALIKLFATSGAFNYVPIDQFRLILNYRALTYFVIAVALGLSAVLLNQVISDQASFFRSLFHGAWCIVLFMLITIEANDFFAQGMIGVTAFQETALSYREMMALACCWMMYSLPLVFVGLKTENLTITVVGLVVVSCAVLLTVIRGIAFDPIESYNPVLNVRVLSFVIVLSGMMLHANWLKENQLQYTWAREVYGVVVVTAVLLVLCLFTGETRDIFEQQLVSIRQRSSGDNYQALSHVENLKQLSLSSLWMAYGILLMAIGIWRRIKGLRVLSIVLLGISILKIFAYDLSFLQTLYRIFSFIGLGVILLTTSYLYQRFKSIIFGEPEQRH